MIIFLQEVFMTGLMSLFGLTMAELVLWSVYTAVSGSVPSGIFGLSRWFDLAIQPVWVILLIVGVMFFGHNSHPEWVEAWKPLILAYWVIAGLASFLVGAGLLIIAIGLFTPLFVLLQVRLSNLAKCDENVFMP